MSDFIVEKLTKTVGDKTVFKKYDSVVIDESWSDAAYEELFSSGA